MEKLKIFLPIIIAIAVAAFIVVPKVSRRSEFTSAAFEGFITDIERRGPESSRSRRTSVQGASTIRRWMTQDEAFAITVLDENQINHEWLTTELAARHYRVGDGFIKKAGKSAPAIIRDGKQIRSRGIPFYLYDEVPVPQRMLK